MAHSENPPMKTSRFHTYETSRRFIPMKLLPFSYPCNTDVFHTCVSYPFHTPLIHVFHSLGEHMSCDRVYRSCVWALCVYLFRHIACTVDSRCYNINWCATYCGFIDRVSGAGVV